MTTPADFADRLAVVQDAEQVLNRVDLNAPEAEATQPYLCCVTSDGGAAHRIALSLIEADPTD